MRWASSQAATTSRSPSPSKSEMATSSAAAASSPPARVARCQVIGIGAAEGEPDVALADVAVLGVRLVNRDDVEVAVAVEVGHLESVAAADRHARGRHVVDDVLAPGDPLAVRGLGAGRGVGDEVGGGGLGRLAGRQDYCECGRKERRHILDGPTSSSAFPASPEGRRGRRRTQWRNSGQPAQGRYQIGDDQARSWIVGGRSGRGLTPARIASQVDQRQVGFSSTRR